MKKNTYTNNIFTDIIEKKASADIVAESANFLCFKDINPKNETHLLAVTKEKYVDFTDLMQTANCEPFFRFIMQIIEKCQIEQYKLVINTGPDCGQCVYHLHVHIMSNKPLRLLSYPLAL